MYRGRADGCQGYCNLVQGYWVQKVGVLQFGADEWVTVPQIRFLHRQPLATDTRELDISLLVLLKSKYSPANDESDRFRCVAGATLELRLHEVVVGVFVSFLRNDIQGCCVDFRQLWRAIIICKAVRGFANSVASLVVAQCTFVCARVFTGLVLGYLHRMCVAQFKASFSAPVARVRCKTQ